MPAARRTPPAGAVPPQADARRSVVPSGAARSLWLAAVWTGAGTALVAGVLAVVTVAVVWLPAAGQAGSAGSAIRAGLLTALAATHGGITVGGLDAAFLPLGLTLALAVLCRRAGTGLADAAFELDEDTPRRLVQATVLQAAAFAATCALLAVWSPLGTSSVPPLGALLAGFVLFAITGSLAFARHSALADAITLPGWLSPALRVAAAVLVTYLAAGALLVAGSLVVHHTEVERLSREVGGGWSGVPILLLGLLAAPNAAVAGAAYLAGPGFALGDGTSVALTSTPHGTLPSFPVLAAVPHGPAGWPAWLLAALTPLVAGSYAAAIARRTASPWRTLGAGTLGCLIGGAVLAWQAGGAIGSGRLHAVGASPWQLGLAVAVAAGAAGALVLGLRVLGDRVRGRERDDPDYVPLAAGAARISEAASGAMSSAWSAVVHRGAAEDDTPDDEDDGLSAEADADGPGKLAG